MSTTQDSPTEHSFIAIDGVKCIKWNFLDVGDTNKNAQAKRRKNKDLVGINHPDIPMLDYKIGLNGEPEICDVIMFCKDILKLEKHTKMSYPESLFHVTSRSWKDSKTFQLYFKRDSDKSLEITVTFYPNKKKIMVQSCETILLQWLSHMKAIIKIPVHHKEVCQVHIPCQR